jgi:hypothetical protein
MEESGVWKREWGMEERVGYVCVDCFCFCCYYTYIVTILINKMVGIIEKIIWDVKKLFL